MCVLLQHGAFLLSGPLPPSDRVDNELVVSEMDSPLPLLHPPVSHGAHLLQVLCQPGPDCDTPRRVAVTVEERSKAWPVIEGAQTVAFTQSGKTTWPFILRRVNATTLWLA
jgi:hypothetical protein